MVGGASLNHVVALKVHEETEILVEHLGFLLDPGLHMGAQLFKGGGVGRKSVLGRSVGCRVAQALPRVFCAQEVMSLDMGLDLYKRDVVVAVLFEKQ